MAKKQLIRLTEEDLHEIIKESVNNILKETFIEQSPYREEVIELLKEKNQDYSGYWIYARNSDLGQITKDDCWLYSIGTSDGNTIECCFLNDNRSKNYVVEFDNLHKNEQEQILNILKAL